MARQEIGGVVDDNNLNKVNHNFIELYQSDRRITDTINDLVLESGGDSNLEVVQARGGKLVLNDRLNDFDSELMSKASKQSLEIERSRINNLVSHASDTDGNAELLDIRVGHDGTLYDTAGDAVRAVGLTSGIIELSVKTGVKRVTSVPTELMAMGAPLERKKLVIKNEDDVLRIRVGENKEGLQQQGFPLEPGASMEFKFKRNKHVPIYAASEGAAVNVSVLEAE